MPLDQLTLHALRRSLRAALPDQKSSHIAEAVAAAMGHRTNASLMSDLSSSRMLILFRDAETNFQSRLNTLAGREVADAAVIYRRCLESILERDVKPYQIRLDYHDRSLLYSLLKHLFKYGNSVPDALRIVLDEVASEGSSRAKLHRCLEQCLDLAEHNAPLHKALAGWIPAVDLKVIEVFENSGNIHRGIAGLEKMPRHRVVDEKQARTVVLYTLWLMIQAGVMMPDAFAEIAQIDWRETGEQEDYIKTITAQMAYKSQQMNLGDAMRGIYPLEERALIAIWGKTERFDEIIEFTGEGKLAERFGHITIAHW